MQTLNTTNSVSVKANIPFQNLINGCKVCSLDSAPTDATEFIFIPLDFEGNLTREVPTGYTEVFTHTFKDGVFPNLDGELNLHGLGYLSFQEIKNHTELYNLLWAKFIDENRMKDITVYSSVPTDRCRINNAKYYEIGFYNIIGGYYQVSEGNYLIKK